MNYKLLTLFSSISLVSFTALAGQSLVSSEGKVRVSSQASGEQVEVRVGTVFAVGELVASEKDKTVLAFPNARLFLSRDTVVAIRAEGVELLAGRVSAVVNDKTTFPLVIGSKQYAISGTAVGTLDKIGESNVMVIAGEVSESELANVSSPAKKYQSGQMSNLAANKSLKKLAEVDDRIRKNYLQWSLISLFPVDYGFKRDYGDEVAYNDVSGLSFLYGRFVDQKLRHSWEVETGVLAGLKMDIEANTSTDEAITIVVPLLFNYKYKLMISSWFGVNAGAGFGAVYASDYGQDEYGYETYSEDGYFLVGQGMLGASFRLNRALDLNVGYRYLFSSSDAELGKLNGSSVELALLYKF